MYIVIAESCYECGNEKAIKKFNNKPTIAEIAEVENALGGMYCISSYIFELKDNEIVTEEYEENK